MLNEKHKADLLSHAIPTDYAEAEGIRSVATKADLPDGYGEFSWKLPGLLFEHTEPSEDCKGWRTEFQLKTDDRTDLSKKYLQRANSGTVRSMDSVAQQRFTDGTFKRVWWAEGTQQYRAIAAVIAFMDGTENDPFADVLCIGMQGCWGWAVEAGIFPGWSKQAMKDREVTVLFDADFATNYRVWEAAEAFVRGAKIAQAASVRLAVGAGTGKAGIDDNLAHTMEMEDRVGELSVIMVDEAVTKLPRKPAKPRNQNQLAGTLRRSASTGATTLPAVVEAKPVRHGAVYIPMNTHRWDRMVDGWCPSELLHHMDWSCFTKDDTARRTYLGSKWGPSRSEPVAVLDIHLVPNGVDDSTDEVWVVRIAPADAPVEWNLGDDTEPVELTIPDLLACALLRGRVDVVEAFIESFDGRSQLWKWLLETLFEVGVDGVMAEALTLTGLPEKPLGPLAAMVESAPGIAGGVRVYGDPSVELYIVFGGATNPGQTGTWRIEECTEYRDGQPTTVRKPTKTNDWAAWPIARSEVRGHPEATTFDLLIVKGWSWKIIKDVPASEVDDPEKIKLRDYKMLGLHVPKNRSSNAYNDLVACLETAGIPEMKVLPRLDEFGWHMIGDEAGWSSSQGTVFHNRIDPDTRTRLVADLQGFRGIGFAKLPDDPRTAFAVVKKYIELSSKHPEMMVALLGVAIASYGHPTAGGMCYVWGESDSLKSYGSMACNAFGSTNPRALHGDLRTSSAKGIGELMGMARDTPLIFDDFRQGAGGSSEASKAFETAASQSHGGADQLKARRDGGLQDRKLAIGTSVIATGEHSVEGNEAMDNRTLAFGPSLAAEPWIDGDLYDDFMDNLTGLANQVGATVVQVIAQHIQNGGELAPEGTIESLQETSDKFIKAKLRETVKKHRRASETVAKPALGWHLLRVAAEAVGAEDLLPSEEEIDRYLDDVLKVTSDKNKASSKPEACKQAVIDAIGNGIGYLTAIGKVCPSQLLPESVMAAAGWLRNERFEGWEHAYRADWAGVITPDRKTVWLSSSWIKCVVTERFTTIAPNAIPTAMIGWAPDGVDLGGWKPGRGAPTIPSQLRSGSGRGFPVPADWFGIAPWQEPKDEHSVGKPDDLTAKVILPAAESGYRWALVHSDDRIVGSPWRDCADWAEQLAARRDWCRCTDVYLCPGCESELERGERPDVA